MYTPNTPDLDSIVEEARELIGLKVPEEMVCTDVYVKAVEAAGYNLSGEMVDHFRHLKKRRSFHFGSAPEVYSKFDMRYRWGLRQLKSLIELLNPKDRFVNNADDPYFTRRIQNVKAWQKCDGKYYKAEEKPRLEPGMAIYWMPRHQGWQKITHSKEPTHMGIITEVKDGIVTKVIHASYRAGTVIEQKHDKVLETMQIVGYGQI
jgi:hypothetical protein